MAKVFNIEFRYRGNLYTAMVSMRPSGSDHAVYVHIDDKSLHQLVPDGELNFRLTNGLRKAAEPAGKTNKELLVAVREAIITHLKPFAELSDPY